MKIKSIIITPFLILGFLNVQADIIPENSHFVTKCIKIVNAEQLSNTTIVGFDQTYGPAGNNKYVITESTCLHKSYKFAPFDVFAVPQNYLNTTELESIDLFNNGYVIEANIEIDPYEGYYHDSIPIDNISEEYTIAGFTDNSVVIYLSKKTIGYNDGTADSVFTYDYDGDINKLSQNIPTNIESLKPIQKTEIYPNPTNGSTQLTFSNSYSGRIDCFISNCQGTIVKKALFYKTYNEESFLLNMSDLNPALYNVELHYGDVIETNQIIIQ